MEVLIPWLCNGWELCCGLYLWGLWILKLHGLSAPIPSALAVHSALLKACKATFPGVHLPLQLCCCGKSAPGVSLCMLAFVSIHRDSPGGFPPCLISCVLLCVVCLLFVVAVFVGRGAGLAEKQVPVCVRCGGSGAVRLIGTLFVAFVCSLPLSSPCWVVLFRALVLLCWALGGFM